MRRSHGSLSSFCSAGPPSLAPRPRPPYLVVVDNDVFRYESYSNGQFCPQTFGSAVSSVTSATRTNGCLASVLRWQMLVSSASSKIVIAATAPKATAVDSQRREPPAPFTGIACASDSTADSVARARVAMHTFQVGPAPVERGDEIAVTAETILLRDVTVACGDLDRLLEVLERERDGMPKAVIRLRDPLGKPRGGQMTVDTRGHVAMPALHPGAVLLVHHVTVDARARIRGQVGQSSGVPEGEQPHAGEDPHGAREPHEDASLHHVSSMISTMPQRASAESPTPEV